MNTRSQTRYNARPKGVTVTPLNLDADMAEALTKWTEAHPDAERPYTKARSEDGWALAVAPDGTEYLVCSEGVGYPLDPDDNEFDIWLSTETSFGMFPQMALHLTADEVHARVTETTVDLVDHIRVFGARLEDNFRTWHATLTKEATS